MKGKVFHKEITRALEGGRLIPQLWMKRAVGEELSGAPLLKSTKEALGEI